MPRFAANLSWLYTDHAFVDRFAAAARDGFDGIECLFPYEYEAKELRERLDEHGLCWVLFNAPPGNWAAGERGLAALPGREEEFRCGIEQALDVAHTLGCSRLHVMAGLAQSHIDPERQWATYQSNLAWAAAQSAPANVKLLIEPINPIDMPGYLLTRQADAHRLVTDINAPNLLVQMDLYHCQIVEGEVMSWLTGALHPQHGRSRVGHMQIAGVPGRHEPDEGAIDYPAVFELIDQLGYAGWVGCEYKPRRAAEPGGTSAGLAWMRPHLDQQKNAWSPT
jgi:hydroxypyruvate isomerase